MSVTYKCPECGLSEPECLENSNKRAYELLWEHLSPNQQYTLWWVGGFVVPAPASRSQYIVTTRNPYGVYRAREESLTVDARLCAYPKFNDRLWMGDLLLAQKLWLETDPVAFEHVANIDRDRTFVNEVNGDWRVVGGLRDAVEKPERPESLSTLEREMISNMDREMVQIELRTVVVARKEACYWAAHYKVSPGSVSKRASLTI